MASPYIDLPAKSFWKSGVAERDISALYSPKFPIDRDTRIATAGSCFAQHIAVRLKQRNFNVLDMEPPPPGLPTEIGKSFGYNLYSARYGNIYTARQLLQLVLEAHGRFTPGEVVWEKDGRYYDALRPSVEPEGLDRPKEVLAHRKSHLHHVRRMLKDTDLLIFTLGLTEAWVHKATGTVFPTAPETIAGRFDPDVYEFKNFSSDEIIADFLRVRKVLMSRNPDIKFLLTVSPVPLTATASTDHVLVATTYSKSTLRAAAGVLAKKFENVDYFPSYEIIATPFLGRVFYDANMRSVSKEGVDTVMQTFFASRGEEAVADGEAPIAPPPVPKPVSYAGPEEQVVCEDILLESFGR